MRFKKRATETGSACGESRAIVTSCFTNSWRLYRADTAPCLRPDDAAAVKPAQTDALAHESVQFFHVHVSNQEDALPKTRRRASEREKRRQAWSGGSSGHLERERNDGRFCSRFYIRFRCLPLTSLGQ